MGMRCYKLQAMLGYNPMSNGEIIHITVSDIPGEKCSEYGLELSGSSLQHLGDCSSS